MKVEEKPWRIFSQVSEVGMVKWPWRTIGSGFSVIISFNITFERRNSILL